MRVVPGFAPIVDRGQIPVMPTESWLLGKTIHYWAYRFWSSTIVMDTKVMSNVVAPSAEHILPTCNEYSSNQCDALSAFDIWLCNAEI